MTLCFFVSDLHGRVDRFGKLAALIEQETPAAVFTGGDLLPHGYLLHKSKGNEQLDFVNKVMVQAFTQLKNAMGNSYPEIFIIMGNDDPIAEESSFIKGEKKGLWKYINNKSVNFRGFDVFGYSYVPPTPYKLKDWEKFDVSRHVEPGCLSPLEGYRSVDADINSLQFQTIKQDLESFGTGGSLSKSVFLFHSPPYKTKLDRAALDGKMIEHAPLDVHVGSVAIKKFIEQKQPYITLHGHIHESTRLTGEWKQRLGETFSFQAAHDGSELSVVKFDLDNPSDCSRMLI